MTVAEPYLPDMMMRDADRAVDGRMDDEELDGLLDRWWDLRLSFDTKGFIDDDGRQHWDAAYQRLKNAVDSARRRNDREDRKWKEMMEFVLGAVSVSSVGEVVLSLVDGIREGHWCGVVSALVVMAAVTCLFIYSWRQLHGRQRNADQRRKRHGQQVR